MKQSAARVNEKIQTEAITSIENSFIDACEALGTSELLSEAISMIRRAASFARVYISVQHALKPSKGSKHTRRAKKRKETPVR